MCNKHLKHTGCQQFFSLVWRAVAPSIWGLSLSFSTHQKALRETILKHPWHLRITPKLSGYFSETPWRVKRTDECNILFLINNSILLCSLEVLRMKLSNIFLFTTLLVLPGIGASYVMCNFLFIFLSLTSTGYVSSGQEGWGWWC